MSKHHLNTPLRYGAQSIVQPEACSFRPTESIEDFVLWVMIKKFMGIVQTQTKYSGTKVVIRMWWEGRTAFREGIGHHSAKGQLASQDNPLFRCAH